MNVLSAHSDPGSTCLRIRPYFVARLSGLPASLLEQLRTADLCAAIDALLAMDEAIDVRRDVVSAALHGAIGETTDKTVRNRLLALRRALYNGKSAARPTLTDLVDSLSGTTRQVVVEYRALLTRRAEDIQNLSECYLRNLRSHRASLRKMVADSDFQQAVLLSSPSLFRNIPRYVADDDPGSRNEQIERGLLRYFTRATAKATPFSRFCAVVEGRLVPCVGTLPRDGLLRLTRSACKKRGFVRLNKSLFSLLWSHLTSREAIRQATRVDLNCTLEVDGQRLRFLTSENGREVFRRVGRNHALELVVDVLRNGTDATVSEVVERIVSSPAIDTTYADARAYVDGLLKVGLLRLRAPVADQEVQWHLPFIEYLCEIDDEHAQLTAKKLAELGKLVAAYAEADTLARTHLSKVITDLIREALTSLGLPAEIPRNLPLYEDAATDGLLLVSETSAVGRALDLLKEFIDLTRALAYPRAEQATMRHWFDGYYPRDEGVPLLQFYEDFYREHFKAHLAEEARARGVLHNASTQSTDLQNPFGLKLVNDIRTAQVRLFDLARRRWTSSPTAEEIALTREDFEAILTNVRPPADDSSSASLFCQIVPGRDVNGLAQIIVGGSQCLIGYGKFMSRFLYMLSDDLQQRVVDDNRALTDARLAEICGDADFNANLHPPLLPFQIEYPTTGHTASGNEMSSSHLMVAPHPTDPHALCLFHNASRDRVIPVDLGILNPRMRPPLHQLLTRFTPPVNYALPLPLPSRQIPRAGTAVTYESTPTESKSGIVYRPRVTYAGAIVLARRCWRIPCSEFPSSVAGELDVEYFLRVNKWRRSHQIPEQGFVRIYALPELNPQRSITPLSAADEQQASAPAGSESTSAASTSIKCASPTLPEAEVNIEVGEASSVAHPVHPNKGPVASVERTRHTAQRASRDARKPQFIDFRSPLLVKLFAKLPGTLTNYEAVMEERYPALADLPSYRGTPHAYELILHIDRVASLAPVPAL